MEETFLNCTLPCENQHLQCLVSKDKITQQKTVFTGKHQPFLQISCHCSHHSSKFMCLPLRALRQSLYSLYSNSGYKIQNSNHAMAHYCKVILSTLVTVEHYSSSALQCIYMLHSTNTCFHYVPTAQDTSLCHINTSIRVKIILNYTWGKKRKTKTKSHIYHLQKYL